MWKIYLFEFLATLVIAIIWVRGITSMHEKYPDYKGEDFLNPKYNEDEICNRDTNN
jgi:hypothetical protein